MHSRLRPRGPEEPVLFAALLPQFGAREWLIDAARLLGQAPEALVGELVDTMVRSGAVVVGDQQLRARRRTHQSRQGR